MLSRLIGLIIFISINLVSPSKLDANDLVIYNQSEMVSGCFVCLKSDEIVYGLVHQNLNYQYSDSLVTNGLKVRPSTTDSTIRYKIKHNIHDGDRALSDISRGVILLFLPGGLFRPPALPGDQIFEERYGVKFVSNGCGIPTDKFEIEYNQEVFKWFDKNYGMFWRLEIRQDVIGLKSEHNRVDGSTGN